MLNQTALASQLLGRQDFVGRTDKYLTFQNALSPYEKALQGLDIYEPANGLLAENFRDQIVRRLNRYREYWMLYRGHHYINMFEDGEEKTVLNYCDTVVDKGADWFLAEGYSITSVEGNEDVANFLNQVFNANEGGLLLRDALMFGGVTGDAFIYVTIQDRDSAGKMLPKEQWRVRLNNINPAFCHPFYDPKNPEVMAACLIQYPLLLKPGAMPVLFTLFITPEYFQTWLAGDDQGKVPNPFGKVNVVHIRNIKQPDSLFGLSDIEAVKGVNRELNDTANVIRRIIKYHAEPTTVIFGASVSTLEKGSKKVWSNLPVDGRVENLVLEANLEATFLWFKELKKEIAIKGELPFVLLDSEGIRISNTSGIAMQMLFQPIVNKTARKRDNYKSGILQVCDLILIAHQDVFGENLAVLADNPEHLHDLDVDWTSPLPRDEQADLDVAVKKVQAGIWSQAEAIRRCSGVSDIARLTLELAADNRAALAEAFENQQASMGQPPNLTSAFLGSPFLSVDLTTLAEELGQTIDEHTPDKPEGEGSTK